MDDNVKKPTILTIKNALLTTALLAVGGLMALIARIKPAQNNIEALSQDRDNSTQTKDVPTTELHSSEESLRQSNHSSEENLINNLVASLNTDIALELNDQPTPYQGLNAKTHITQFEARDLVDRGLVAQLQNIHAKAQQAIFIMRPSAEDGLLPEDFSDTANMIGTLTKTLENIAATETFIYQNNHDLHSVDMDIPSRASTKETNTFHTISIQRDKAADTLNKYFEGLDQLGAFSSVLDRHDLEKLQSSLLDVIETTGPGTWVNKIQPFQTNEKAR